MLETPLGDFIVRAALPNALAYGGKFHAQKTAQVSIETSDQAEVGKIFRRQPLRLPQPNFIEHPAEVVEVRDFLIRTAQAFNFHR